MEQYVITPWALPENPTLDTEFVPPELEQLARQVATHYQMRVASMNLVTSKPDKGGAIWKLETDRGPRSLKVLHRMPQRSLFSIAAQDYLVAQGARVPPILPTKNGERCVEAGGKLWIVTEWIDGLEPVGKTDLESAAALCYGLGEFHRHSRGFVCPPEAVKSSRLNRWLLHYEKIIVKLGWFRHIAEAYKDTASSKQLLSVIGKYEEQATVARKRLAESSYGKMIALGEPHWGLAHQDYGWSNGQMGPGGIWVIDLDGVAYDLPIRDLRKIITSTMDDMGTWDINWIRGIVKAYHEANPIDRETYELLLIDMAFPNEFYKHVKEIVYDPATFMDQELPFILNHVESAEANKEQVLAELQKDLALFSPGEYPDQASPFMVVPKPVPAAVAERIIRKIGEALPPKVKTEPAAAAKRSVVAFPAKPAKPASTTKPVARPAKPATTAKPAAKRTKPAAAARTAAKRAIIPAGQGRSSRRSLI